MANATEIEIKLRIDDPAASLTALQTAGFQISQPREFESNILYDTEDRRLFHSGMLLRLREVGGRSMLTWKGPAVPGPHKSRPERETAIGSSETFAFVLGQLGYMPVFQYEKFRTELKGVPPEATVTVDETPIGNFMELEGPPEWIDSTARALGFSKEDYITESYGGLYRQWCEEHAVQPSHMVFSSK
jgi:adenylate cyclase class 2